MTAEQALQYLSDKLTKYAQRPDSSTAYIKQQETAINVLITEHNRQETADEILQKLYLFTEYLMGSLPVETVYYLQRVAYLLDVDCRTPGWFAELAIKIPFEYYQDDTEYAPKDLYFWLYEKQVQQIKNEIKHYKKVFKTTGETTYYKLIVLLEKRLEIKRLLFDSLHNTYYNYGTTTKSNREPI